MSGQKVGYVRVSAADQNPDRQLVDVELDKKFVEKCSGRTIERPLLKEMLSYLRSGDILIVHSMDRLARNSRDLLNIIEMLTKKDVHIKFLKENLTFSGNDSPMSKLLLSIMSAIGEFELALIQERQREGIKIAKETGKYRGSVRRVTDDMVDQMREMVGVGLSKERVARKFGVSAASVYRYLKMEKNDNF